MCVEGAKEESLRLEKVLQFVRKNRNAVRDCVLNCKCFVVQAFRLLTCRRDACTTN